jgi:hypothetical protein
VYFLITKNKKINYFNREGSQMSKNTFFWKKANTPEELQSMLETLSADYPISLDGQGTELVFKKSPEAGKSKVSFQGDSVEIEYGCTASACRGLGSALAGVGADEKTVFKTLGIMLDCSRNAVMTVDHFKKWLRSLALMGYNMAMLYTEDTYKLPDEPYFGYMRGAYTLEEIKEIDAYAKALNIEMIGCIQTLGHLAQILKWTSGYGDMTDTSSVMMVDEDRTYDLIDKMIKFWGEGLSSKRIHIGMDETHDLGRGKFMDKKGYERGFDIFNRHLAKVNDICEKYELKPIIWSDMYFRMGNPNQSYYDLNSDIPEDVKKAIPENVDLVYWDYYNKDKDFYVDFIKMHRDLDKEPLMGSGIWTWSKMWFDHEQNVKTVKPCLDACRETKLDEVFFTLWGDDGAFCEFDSCLAGLCWAAELSYGGCGCEDKLEKMFKVVCGSSYKAHVEASKLEVHTDEFIYGAAWVIWDDPLLGMNWKNSQKVKADFDEMLSGIYSGVREYLAQSRDDKACGDLNHAWLLADMLFKKIKMQKALYAAYDAKDKEALKKVKDCIIPETIAVYKEFSLSFRAQWLRHNKPFGLEVIQSRMAAQVARMEECILRLSEYLDGQVDNIPELEEKLETDKYMSYPRHCRWATSSTNV